MKSDDILVINDDCSTYLPTQNGILMLGQLANFMNTLFVSMNTLFLFLFINVFFNHLF